VLQAREFFFGSVKSTRLQSPCNRRRLSAEEATAALLPLAAYAIAFAKMRPFHERPWSQLHSACLVCGTLRAELNLPGAMPSFSAIESQLTRLMDSPLPAECQQFGWLDFATAVWAELCPASSFAHSSAALGIAAISCPAVAAPITDDDVSHGTLQSRG
jgi:hypothetical protein